MSSSDAGRGRDGPPVPRWVRRRGGLRFACIGCGACCRGADAYVWLEHADVERLAAHLGLSLAALGRRYVRRVDGELCLKDGPAGACVFLEPDGGCRVYGARPEQCRTFPFWEENLASPGAWRRGTEGCPGCRGGEGARRYSVEEILVIVRGEAATGATRPGETHGA